MTDQANYMRLEKDLAISFVVATLTGVMTPAQLTSAAHKLRQRAEGFEPLAEKFLNSVADGLEALGEAS